MKKILLMLLCGALMLSVFACDKPKKQNNPPKMDPPDWEELTDEYDDWASECVNYRKSYEKAPDNPVNQNMLKKWPRDIADWEVRVAEMLEELKDFPEEKSAYIAELKNISKKLTGIEATAATQDEIDTFLSEYEAWADEFVAYEKANEDNKVSEAYKSKHNDYVFESAYWGNLKASFNLRIEDADKLSSFNTEVASIEAKIATVKDW